MNKFILLITYLHQPLIGSPTIAATAAEFESFPACHAAGIASKQAHDMTKSDVVVTWFCARKSDMPAAYKRPTS
jgi:hypothetical protein